MEKIKNQKHSKEAFYYSFSRMFERASYYGLRALVVLYMIGGTLKMDNVEALKIYGWITAALVFSQIVGALLGDLVIGNKKSIIIGSIIQAIGAFSLSIPSTTGLYIGLFLIVTGSGFFTPNIISDFGKLYLSKTKLLDAGFTLFYLAVNLGSFLGILLIGYIGESYGYNIGFIIAGILSLLSIAPILVSRKQIAPEVKNNPLPINKRIAYIVIAFITVALFWNIYQIANIRIFDLQQQFNQVSSFEFLKNKWQAVNSYFILPISLIAIVLWSIFYNSQLFKLMLGFIFGTISIGILFLIPELPTEQHTATFLVSLFFLSISEIHIAPIIYSILTKYTNPKYLAIVISLAFLPTKLMTLAFALFNDTFYDNPILGVKFGIIAMGIVGIGLFSYIFWYKKQITY